MVRGLCRIVAGLALGAALPALLTQPVHATALDTEEVERLAFLASDNDFTIAAHPLVVKELHSLVGSSGGRAGMARALQGLAQYEELVYASLDALNLPPQLAAVPLVESGYQNIREGGQKPEHLRAAGLWQFLPGTARAYGLRVDGEVDQRMNPAALTRAAARMFADLHAQLGDWGLVLAGYNMGPGRVERAITEAGTADPYTLMERGHLNTYAARVMAAALVMENAEAFGL